MSCLICNKWTSFGMIMCMSCAEKEIKGEVKLPIKTECECGVYLKPWDKQGKCKECLAMFHDEVQIPDFRPSQLRFHLENRIWKRKKAIARKIRLQREYDKRRKEGN